MNQLRAAGARGFAFLHDAKPTRDFRIGLDEAAHIAAEAILVELVADEAVDLVARDVGVGQLVAGHEHVAAVLALDHAVIGARLDRSLRTRRVIGQQEQHDGWKQQTLAKLADPVDGIRATRMVIDEDRVVTRRMKLPRQRSLS